MKIFGLIGYPLSHSFSKKYFTQKFAKENIKDCSYELFPIEEIDQLPELISNIRELRGLNVTIPYKEKVIDFLDELEEGAKAVAAVNTIRIADQKLTGYNTDVFGFEKSLRGFVEKSRRGFPEKALILGTGGAAKAVHYVLEKLGIKSLMVSRSIDKGQLNYTDLDALIIKENQLIINTTPLGMSPDIQSFPSLPYREIGRDHLLFDLVYNPGKTVFLEKGEDQGAAIQNGLDMLYGQAEKAWEIWNQ